MATRRAQGCSFHTRTQCVTFRLMYKACRLLLLMGALLVGPTVFAPLPAWAQELFVTNFNNNSVTVYNRTDNGNSVAPIRTIIGGLTGLSGPKGIAIGPSTTTVIPTVGPWGMATLGLAFLGVMAWILKARRSLFQS